MKTKQFFNIPVIRSLTAADRLKLINLLNKIGYNSLPSSRKVMKQLNKLIWAIAIPDNDPNFFILHAYAPNHLACSNLSLANDVNHVNDTRIGIRLSWSRQGSSLLQLLKKIKETSHDQTSLQGIKAVFNNDDELKLLQSIIL